MQHLNTGALALYHGKAAVITAINKDKIDIRIEGGSAKSVRPKDIEVIHPGPGSRRCRPPLRKSRISPRSSN